MKKIIRVEKSRNGIWLDANVTYGQVGAWFSHVTLDLKMDIMRPFPDQNQEEAKVYPCIIWICGGAWIQMDRHAHLPNFIELVRQGYVIASVDYRDSNQVKFPGQLEDIKAAVRYLRAHAQRYGINPKKIGVMGESAGGHLTAMLAVTGEHKEYDTGAYLEYSSAVSAACPWYLPCDFSQMPPRDDISLAMSPESLLIGDSPRRQPELAKKASPLSFIDSHTPPFLLLHGTKDDVVPYAQSEVMYEALTQAGIETTLIGIEGANHADIHFFQPEVMTIITEFFDKHLKDKEQID